MNWCGQLFHQHADSAQELTKLTVADRSRCRNYRCILVQSQSASPYENPAYAKGRQSYGLQAIGSHSGRRESNVTQSARCLSGAENVREQGENN